MTLVQQKLQECIETSGTWADPKIGSEKQELAY